jgi:hypothetical protein
MALWLLLLLLQGQRQERCKVLPELRLLRLKHVLLLLMVLLMLLMHLLLHLLRLRLLWLLRLLLLLKICEQGFQSCRVKSSKNICKVRNSSLLQDGLLLGLLGLLLLLLLRDAISTISRHLHRGLGCMS